MDKARDRPNQEDDVGKVGLRQRNLGVEFMVYACGFRVRISWACSKFRISWFMLEGLGP